MPTSAAFSVSGIIIDADGRPLPDAEVAATSDDGRYRIDVSALEDDVWVEVFIEAARGGRAFGRSEAVVPHPERIEIDLQVRLDGQPHVETPKKRAERERAAAEAAERERRERERDQELNLRVSGVVRDRFGDLMPGVTVEVYDCDLRNRELLGTTQTSADAAAYELAYRRFQFARAQKASADLIVRVVGPNHETLGESPLVPNAPPPATIDIDLSGAAWARHAMSGEARTAVGTAHPCARAASADQLPRVLAGV